MPGRAPALCSSEHWQSQWHQALTFAHESTYSCGKTRKVGLLKFDTPERPENNGGSLFFRPRGSRSPSGGGRSATGRKRRSHVCVVSGIGGATRSRIPWLPLGASA